MRGIAFPFLYIPLFFMTFLPVPSPSSLSLSFSLSPSRTVRPATCVALFSKGKCTYTRANILHARPSDEMDKSEGRLRRGTPKSGMLLLFPFPLNWNGYLSSIQLFFGKEFRERRAGFSAMEVTEVRSETKYFAQ